MLWQLLGSNGGAVGTALTQFFGSAADSGSDKARDSVSAAILLIRTGLLGP